MRTRLRLVVGALFIAMVPFAGTAHAQTVDAAATAALGAKANWVNDLERCRLATTGVQVPGTIGFSQPTPTGLMNTCQAAPGVALPEPTHTLAVGTAGCVSSPNKFEMNLINAWAISVQKAITDKNPPPAQPPDVMALVGAC